MELIENRINGETLYSGKTFTVQKDLVKLQDGSEFNREVVRHPGGCCVVAIDKNKNILVVKQFRYAHDKVTLEIPAGKFDKIGESPLETAKRELLEETGFKANNWIELGSIYTSPGYCDEILYLYAATDIHKISAQNLDEGENLTASLVPFDDIVNKIMCGTIKDSKTICAILKVKFLQINGKFVI